MSYEIDADALFSFAEGRSGSGSGSCGSPAAVSSPEAEDTRRDLYDNNQEDEGPSFPDAQSAMDSSAPIPTSLSFKPFQSFNSFPGRGAGFDDGGRGRRPYGGRGGRGGYGGGLRDGGPRRPGNFPHPNPRFPETRRGGGSRGGAGVEFDPNLPTIHPRGAADPTPRATSIHFGRSATRAPGGYPTDGRSFAGSSQWPRPPPTQQVSARRDDLSRLAVPDSKPSIASIIPEGKLRDRIIEETERNEEKAAKESGQRRKRPGAASISRKRPRTGSSVGSGAFASAPLPAKKAPSASAPKFGNLLSLASGTGLAGLKKNAPKRPGYRGASLSQSGHATGVVGNAEPGGRSSNSATTPARLKRNIYVQATTTKESIELEEEQRREEEARIEEAHLERRKEERHQRRVMAVEMRKVPTVSSAMRDSHMLDRVERHLFNDDQGKTVRSSVNHVGLTRRDVGTNDTVEQLWTIVIEEF